jgi:hypothetical protein
MNYKLYRLTATVANDRYDGRKKYGIGSIKAFEVGTTYSMLESEPMPGEHHFRNPAHLQYGEVSTVISRELELLLLSVSADVPMVSWSDVQKVIDPHPTNGWLSAAVLEALVIRGIVDVTTLHQFANDIYNSPEQA